VAPCSREHRKLVALEAELALWDVDGNLVLAAPAGGAVLAGRSADAAEHPLQREVVNAVHLKVFADLLDGPAMRNQFLRGGEIDPVEAGMANGRAGDAQMNLLGAGTA